MADLFVKTAEKQSERRRSARDRYFEGYTPVTAEKKNGKGVRTKMVYTAPYHCQDMEDGELKRQKLLFALACVFSAAAVFAAGFLSLRLVQFKPAAVVYGLVLIGLVWWIYETLLYVTAKRKMTAYEARSNHQNLAGAAFVSFGLAAAAFLAAVIGLFFPRGGVTGGDAAAIACFVFAAFAAFFTGRREKRTLYCEVPNENAAAAEEEEMEQRGGGKAAKERRD